MPASLPTTFIMRFGNLFTSHLYPIYLFIYLSIYLPIYPSRPPGHLFLYDVLRAALLLVAAHGAHGNMTLTTILPLSSSLFLLQKTFESPLF